MSGREREREEEREGARESVREADRVGGSRDISPLFKL
jgi:hypothetical protein